MTLATLARRARSSGADGDDVQVVYVTVDPERDDAAQMKKYLGSFDPSFVGGTGTPAQLDAAQKSYGIRRRRVVNPDGSYTIGPFVVHLPDRSRGRLRALMPYGHPAEDFVHDVKILLRD